MKQVEFLRFLYDNTVTEQNIDWELDENTGDVSAIVGKNKIFIYTGYMIIVVNNNDSKTFYIKPESEKYVDKIREYVKITKEEEFFDSVYTSMKDILK